MSMKKTIINENIYFIEYKCNNYDGRILLMQFKL